MIECLYSVCDTLGSVPKNTWTETHGSTHAHIACGLPRLRDTSPYLSASYRILGVSVISQLTFSRLENCTPFHVTALGPIFKAVTSGSFQTASRVDD